MKFLPCLITAGCFFVACQKTTNTTTTITEPKEKPPVVNAGPSQIITLPVDSVSVTGAVIDTGSKVAAYLWSEVSGPNVPVIADQGSISTKINGMVPGSYIFQLMAVDTAGLTGVDTLQVTVNPNPLDSIVLQPTNNPGEYLFAGNSTADYSPGWNHVDLTAIAWTINGITVYFRSAFKFDLSVLPVGATLDSAKLTLYSNPTPNTTNYINANNGTANAFYIRRINSDWSTSTGTWANQPGTDTENQLLIPSTNQAFLDLVNLDVTSLVKTMISSGNYGFMMQLQNEQIYNSREFAGSQYSDSTKHPRLVLYY